MVVAIETLDLNDNAPELDRQYTTAMCDSSSVGQVSTRASPRSRPQSSEFCLPEPAFVPTTMGPCRSGLIQTVGAFPPQRLKKEINGGADEQPLSSFRFCFHATASGTKSKNSRSEACRRGLEVVIYQKDAKGAGDSALQVFGTLRNASEQLHCSRF